MGKKINLQLVDIFVTALQFDMNELAQLARARMGWVSSTLESGLLSSTLESGLLSPTPESGLR